MKLSAGITSRLIASATDLLEDVQRLTTSLARPAPSIYVTQFSSSAGGNEYLLMELARRLEDHTDATRPPFDDSEYVCGVCFVAGAPRAADLAKTTAFFNTVLGPANAANPLLGLLASIDTVVTQAETAVFGPDMQPLPPGSVVNPLTGLLPVPVQPVTANNGTAVEVDDPQNPNAGDTNVKSPSDICGC